MKIVAFKTPAGWFRADAVFNTWFHTRCKIAIGKARWHVHQYIIKKYGPTGDFK